MKNLIIPTIFATSKKKFDNRFKSIIKISKNIQIDFMDGKFVKAKSISMKNVPDLKKYKNNFEAHLMVKNPLLWINNLKDKGFRKIIFHYEALKDQEKIINLVRILKKGRMKSFIALNPETDILKVLPFLPDVNGILLMGHKPGVEHISILPSIYKKIKSLRLINKNISIQIDGGVNDENIKKLALAGADIFNIGSYITDSENPRAILLILKNKLNDH